MARDPEKVRAARRRWVARNPEKQRAAVQAWKRRNPALVNTYAKRWSANHPDHRAAISGKQLAIRRAPGCIVEPFDLVGTIPFYAQARCLTRELGIPHEVDHILPLAKGGRHEPTNLQVIPQRVNRVKGGK
jgi:5-methylcytosine-specific restriction endonuclease McrA